MQAKPKVLSASARHAKEDVILMLVRVRLTARFVRHAQVAGIQTKELAEQNLGYAKLV